MSITYTLPMRVVAKFTYQKEGSPYAVRPGDVCTITHILDIKSVIDSESYVVEYINAYGVWMSDALSSFVLPTGIKNETAHSCEYGLYRGFTDSFEYCVKCGMKKV